MIDKFRATSAGEWVEDTFSPRSPWMLKMANSQFNGKKRIKFYERVSRYLSNGLKLKDAVELLYEQASEKSRYDSTAVLLREILFKMDHGQRLGDALRDAIPETESMLIVAGEISSASGALPDSFDMACDIIRARQTMIQTIVKSLTMPTLWLLAVFFTFWGFGRYVVPDLEDLLQDATGTAAGLVSIGEFMNSPWALSPLIAFIVLVVAIFGTLKSWKGGVRAMFDRIPVWSFYRLLIGGGWLFSIGAMVRSGIKVNDALLSTLESVSGSGKRSNPWLAYRLEMALEQFHGGKNIGKALQATGLNFPDKDLLDDLVVYAQMDSFDSLLFKVAKEWIDEGVELVKVQAGALKLIVEIIAYVSLAYLAFAVLAIQMKAGGMV